MRELLNKFLIWLRKPDPDTILIKLWRKKRATDNALKEIEAKRQAKEYRQKVEEQAYLLWETDGKPEGKDEHYWRLAVDKVKGKNVPTFYKLYYLPEKLIFEPIDAWIKRQALISIFSQLAVLAAIIAFIGGENVRRNNEVFTAWQTITSADGKPGSGGRIEALQFLNSRPLRFPWIGWTKKDWYWDGKECKRKLVFGRRWKRKPLIGLSASSGAYLANVNLCGANLRRTNLQQADLFEANLQETNLLGANLQQVNLYRANLQQAVLYGVVNLIPKQIKSACNWEEAIYKQDQSENQKFIEDLKKDIASNPKKDLDCSFWEK